jgi:hypothetical protein
VYSNDIPSRSRGVISMNTKRKKKIKIKVIEGLETCDWIATAAFSHAVSVFRFEGEERV